MSIKAVCFDIDGTLTDSNTWYAGEQIGWIQRFSVRDGESILRLSQSKMIVTCISRNKTKHAKIRMELLGIDCTWLGVTDKIKAIHEFSEKHNISLDDILYVGDGPEDAEVFKIIGYGIAVSDAHLEAKESAKYVLKAKGGDKAMEEIEYNIKNNIW